MTVSLCSAMSQRDHLSLAGDSSSGQGLTVGEPALDTALLSVAKAPRRAVQDCSPQMPSNLASQRRSGLEWNN